VRLEEFGFPPRVSNVKETIVLLRHPELGWRKKLLRHILEKESEKII